MLKGCSVTFYSSKPLTAPPAAAACGIPCAGGGGRWRLGGGRGGWSGGSSGGGGRPGCGGRWWRARSHCRFAPPLIHFIPDSLTYSVPLFLKRQCDRTLGGGLAGAGRGGAAAGGGSGARAAAGGGAPRCRFDTFVTSHSTVVAPAARCMRVLVRFFRDFVAGGPPDRCDPLPTVNRCVVTSHYSKLTNALSAAALRQVLGARGALRRWCVRGGWGAGWGDIRLSPQ